MKTGFDHLVIGAASLEQGRAFVSRELGVDIPYGGAHQQMATHNCLMRLSETTFLEVIAIDHEAEQPLHPRWFGLDDVNIRKNLAIRPRLLTWVVSTADIKEILDSATVDCGSAWAISRGDLQWYFGVPDDGRLLAGGILPYIISWQKSENHPASGMAERDCTLSGFRLYTPYVEWTEIHLLSIGVRTLVDIISLSPGSTPYLEAEISTPTGLKLLRSSD